jgi:cytochrome c-type biogenesis protein CcmH/NrfG
MGYGSTQWDTKLDRAIGEARKALKTKTGDPVLNYVLAEALLRRGSQPGDSEFEEAHAALLRAIESQPGFSKARTALAKVYLRLGKTQDAIRELEHALKLDPNDQIVASTLVTALQRSGEADQVRAVARQLRQLLNKEQALEAERARMRLLATGHP